MESKEKTRCILCGSENVDLHHQDGNRYNNAHDNFYPLCRQCHLRVHNNTLSIEEAKNYPGLYPLNVTPAKVISKFIYPAIVQNQKGKAVIFLPKKWIDQPVVVVGISLDLEIKSRSHTMRDRIVKFLNGHPGKGFKPREIAKHLGYGNSSVRKCLQRMTIETIPPIIRVKTGQYVSSYYYEPGWDVFETKKRKTREAR